MFCFRLATFALTDRPLDSTDACVAEFGALCSEHKGYHVFEISVIWLELRSFHHAFLLCLQTEKFSRVAVTEKFSRGYRLCYTAAKAVFCAPAQSVTVVETAPKAVERSRSRSVTRSVTRSHSRSVTRSLVAPYFARHVVSSLRTQREHRERIESLERQIAIAHRINDQLFEVAQRQHAYSQRNRRAVETLQERFRSNLGAHLTLFERQTELEGAARALDSFVTALQTAHSQRLAVLESRHIRLLQTTRDLLEAAELLQLFTARAGIPAGISRLPSLLREARNSLPDETDAAPSSSAPTPGAALEQAQSALRFAFDNLYLDTPR